MSGFADVIRSMDEAGEASVRPAGGRDGGSPRAGLPPDPPPAADDLPGWAAKLTPAAQGILATKLAQARTGYDPLQVSQGEIDLMSDDEKWRYAEQVVAREGQLEAQARARLEAESNALAQTEMEGHQ